MATGWQRANRKEGGRYDYSGNRQRGKGAN